VVVVVVLVQVTNIAQDARDRDVGAKR